MLISEDIKLDYSDVLIRPKGQLNSRMKFTEELISFYGKKEWIEHNMVSNMDTVGTCHAWCVTKHA